MKAAVKLGIAGGCVALAPALFLSAAVGAIIGDQAQQQNQASAPSASALDDIPDDFLTLYQQASQVCPGLDWTVLAAVGDVETDHNRIRARGVTSGENYAGAGGPMQFLQPTFDSVLRRHPLPPGGANPPSRYNPHDAVYAAAFYLCDSGARDGTDIRGALFQYNHAGWYVDEVLARASRYADAQTNPTTPAPTQAASNAIAFAQAQIGLAYVWGGNGPQDGGFDCSGLTTAAYASAGIELPRTAQAQYQITQRVAEADLRLGDLVFYGNPATAIHHVGLYIGNGQIIDAPTTGSPVGVRPLHWGPRDDFAGGGRVAAEPIVGSPPT
jgi:cell wall-associated NlpC family hydrolase